MSENGKFEKDIILDINKYIKSFQKKIKTVFFFSSTNTLSIEVFLCQWHFEVLENNDPDWFYFLINISGGRLKR